MFEDNCIIIWGEIQSKCNEIYEGQRPINLPGHPMELTQHYFNHKVNDCLCVVILVISVMLRMSLLFSILK